MINYRRLTVLFIALLLNGCSRQAEPPQAATESLRQLNNGAVVGFADRYDTWSWLGIPFAQAPQGDLRWRAPRPASNWDGTLQALSFSQMCPQMPIPIVNDTDEEWLGDEDCLYLNVSAPRSWSAGDSELPVMVWMHGGGNTVGSADLYSALRNLAAREQVVVVSIHYRLGILGWFSHPAMREQANNKLDASGNFGTLDSIAALQWVAENIHHFGGNADNVTLFGESAGGINTFALLLSPLAQGLFHQAISQSGILMTSTVASAEHSLDDPQPGSINGSTELLLRLIQSDGKAANRSEAIALLENWDSVTTMSYLRDKTPLQLLQQMQGVQSGMYQAPNLLRDGTVLPQGDPLEHLAQGEFNRVPVILGTNRDEMKTMMIRNPVYTKLRFGLIPQVKDQAMYDRVTGYGSAMWKATGADEPASAMYAAGHRNIFVYRFDWDEVPSYWLLDFKSLMGAGHSVEIPFVFADTDNEMTYTPMPTFDDGNREAALELVGAMTGYWGEFAHNGAPGTGSKKNLPAWSPWNAQGQYLLLDTPVPQAIGLQDGRWTRERVFRELATDQEGLGGQVGICQAYTQLFGEKAIFGFSAACTSRADCPGAVENFCPGSAAAPGGIN